jgi:hypothetical protein
MLWLLTSIYTIVNPNPVGAREVRRGGVGLYGRPLLPPMEVALFVTRCLMLVMNAIKEDLYALGNS